MRLPLQRCLCVWFAWLIAASPSVWAGEVAAPAEFAEVRRFVLDSVEAGEAPSIALAVVRDGVVVWAEGFGYADLHRKTPASPESVYRLASVSKPITATAMMTLVEQGKLDLDAPANRYLPGASLRAYVGSAEEMTLRLLANHTSGLPVHYNFFYGRKPVTVDAAIARYGFAATRPGSRWEYSNLGFGVINYISEVVSGTAWAELMRGRIFDPLGMTHSAAGIRSGQESAAVVHYTRDGAGRYVPVAYYDFDHPGGSVVCSSAADLARFARMHLAGGELEGTRVLREESVREMQRPTGAGRYGIGWFAGSFHGQRVVDHSGGMPGVATFLRLFPEQRGAVVVLTNRDSTRIPREVAQRVGSVLVPEVSQEAPLRNSPGPEAPPKLPTGHWRGRLIHFDGDVPVALEITLERRARIRLGDQTAEVTDARLRGDRVVFSIAAKLRTQSDFHGTPAIEFRLARDGEGLTGVAVAVADGYFALSHWVELTPQATGE